MTRYTPLWLQQGSYPAGIDRRLIGTIWPAAASKGAALNKVAGTMTANIAAGSVAIPANNGTGSTLCVWDANELVTFAPAPGSGLSRFDVVYVLPRGNDLDGGANNDFIFGVVTGTATSGTPVAPATPAGGQPLWVLLIPGGVASIDTVTPSDYRPGGMPSDTGWLALPLGPNCASYGGAFRAVTYRALNGRVYFDGLIQTTAAVAANTAIANVPVGVRPVYQSMFAAAANPTGTGPETCIRLDVYTDGRVLTTSALASSAYVGLSGINYSLT